MASLQGLGKHNALTLQPTKSMNTKYTAGRLVVIDGQELHILNGSEDRLVAQCHAGHAPERQANAARLAHVWNMHDTLVEACKAALVVLTADSDSERDNATEIKQLRQALSTHKDNQ